ncbi:putative ATP-dependent DNA helicase Q4 isoform X2 [Apostichopus japonicus]|uniref:Putative ATP-dependent DNA helicase Q4 isoform X2 n=1 Tax=Stichopus japonicus TaxID=307972 RepID=A0A2G8LCQ0_STIJA|nr:putative ATP-dependent DNA helicase Q4 isoform X2 [Apostichopus japonicus]
MVYITFHCARTPATCFMSIFNGRAQTTKFQNQPFTNTHEKAGLVDMDILEVKKTLKKWERSFFETHERRPGREDIQQAPKRITDAYQQYQEHKKPSCQSKQPTKIIEAKSPNEKETVCPEVDFWGAHLNKSASSDDGEEKIIKREKHKETALERISKKMRKNIIDSQTPKKSSEDEGSQFKKGKPTSIPSKNSPNDRETFRRKSSEDEISGFSEAGLSPDGKDSIIFKGSAFKIKSSSKSVKSDHVDIFQARRLKPLNRKQTVQTDWLKECGDDLEDLNDKKSSVSQTEVDCPTEEFRDERKVDNLLDKKHHSLDTFVDDRQDGLRVGVGDHDGLEREVDVKLSPDKFEDEGKPIEHHCGVVKRKTKRESFEALESLASKENSELNKLSACGADSDLLSADGVTQSETNESELGISVCSSTNQRPARQRNLGTENGGKHMLDGESGTNNFGENVSNEEYDLCNSEPVDSPNQRACVSRTTDELDGDNDKCVKEISDIENNSDKSNGVGRKRKHFIIS